MDISIEMYIVSYNVDVYFIMLERFLCTCFDFMTCLLLFLMHVTLEENLSIST